MRARRLVLLALAAALPWAVLELAGAARAAGAISGDLGGAPVDAVAGLAYTAAWLAAALAGPPLLVAGLFLGLCALAPSVLRSVAWMRRRASRSSSRGIASSSS